MDKRGPIYNRNTGSIVIFPVLVTLNCSKLSTILSLEPSSCRVKCHDLIALSETLVLPSRWMNIVSYGIIGSIDHQELVGQFCPATVLLSGATHANCQNIRWSTFWKTIQVRDKPTFCSWLVQ